MSLPISSAGSRTLASRRPIAPGAESRYLQVLAEVVADERITLAEAAELEACARQGGLTQIPLEHLHRQAFFHVLGPEVNTPPAELSAIRRRELLSLARALRVSDVVDVLAPLAEADQAVDRKPAGTGYLKGWRIGLDPADSPDLTPLREFADQHDASVAKVLTKPSSSSPPPRQTLPRRPRPKAWAFPSLPRSRPGRSWTKRSGLPTWPPSKAAKPRPNGKPNSPSAIGTDAIPGNTPKTHRRAAHAPDPSPAARLAPGSAGKPGGQ
jgi:hypothetical protein